jgi:hypothetical protein
MRKNSKGSGFLAVGAVKGRALPLHNAADGRFAASAGQAGTVIDHGLELEVALLTVRI